MPATQAGKSRTRRHLPRWAKVTMVIVVLLAALIFGPHLVLYIQIQREYAAIRAEGYPATMDEFDAWASPPERKEPENAADLLDQAVSRLPGEWGWGQREIWQEGVRQLAESRVVPAMYARYFRTNHKSLGMIHRAARMGYYRSHGELGDPAAEGVNALVWEALAMRERGQTAGAAGCILDALRLTDSVRRDPIFGSESDVWLLHLSCVALGRVLSGAQLPEESRALLNAELSKWEDFRCLTLHQVRNRCAYGDMFTQPDKPLLLFAQHGVWTEAYRTVFRVSELGSADHLRAMRLMRERIEAGRLPLAERLRAFRALREEAGKQRQLSEWLSPGTTYSMGWFDVESQYHLEAIAWVLVVRGGLAVERYRNATGRLPETLDSLVPKYMDKMPEDPFDGTPLRYRILGKGYVVYSVGDNRRDDSGMNCEETDSPGTDDVAFTVTR
jgi:hypothetical protein